MATRSKRVQAVKRRPRAKLWNALEAAYEEACKRRPDFGVVYGKLREAIAIVGRIRTRGMAPAIDEAIERERKKP